MNENNLETVTSLSSDLSTREKITIQLEEITHRRKIMMRQSYF